MSRYASDGCGRFYINHGMGFMSLGVTHHTVEPRVVAPLVASEVMETAQAPIESQSAPVSVADAFNGLVNVCLDMGGSFSQDTNHEWHCCVGVRGCTNINQLARTISEQSQQAAAKK